MKDILTQYNLASAGDLSAIKYLIANMGEGKLLKTNYLSLLRWYTFLGKEKDSETYTKLFSPIEYTISDSVVIKPHYEEIQEFTYLKNEIMEKVSEVLPDVEAWEKEKREEALKKETEEKARRLAEQEKTAREAAEKEAALKREAEEKARRLAEQEKAAREAAEKEAALKREAEEKAKRLAEEKARRLAEQEKAAREAAENEKRLRIQKAEKSFTRVLNDFIKAKKTIEFREFLFKKTEIRIINMPITWRIWKAVMALDDIEKWDEEQNEKKSPQETKKVKKPTLDSYLSKDDLGDFLIKFNKLVTKMNDNNTYDYLRNNGSTREKLRKMYEIRDAEYLYIKED